MRRVRLKPGERSHRSLMATQYAPRHTPLQLDDPLQSAAALRYSSGNDVTTYGGTMPRIAAIDTPTPLPEVEALFDKDRARDGQVLNSTRIAAYRPGICAAAKALGKAIADSGLVDPALRSLVKVRIASLVGCEF